MRISDWSSDVCSSDLAEGRCVFQGATQGAGVAETVQAVAERHAAGVAQCNEFSQLFAIEAFAQRADRENLGDAGLAGASEDQFGHGRSIQYRLGLRRAATTSTTPGGDGPSFADETRFAAVNGFS